MCPMEGNDRAFRGIWLALILLGSLVCAGLAAVVVRAAGGEMVTVLTTGGGAFLGLATLGLAARVFLAGPSR
ncbi:putative membrane protein [Streptomyces scabiei 87.22]|uniref:Putative membrane protein n=2 Tax=Streptomyces TaxID=1883 RepID=C9YTR0_STRSW|nr:putative membrane protein [Streptomyces scabiei 87.22]